MRFPRPQRHHLLAAALLLVLGAGSLLIGGPERGTVEAPVPTTYSTEPGGLQGLYRSCRGLGIPAERHTGRLEDLDPGTIPAVAVVGDPEPGVDPAPLLAFAEAGGRLLLATGDERLLAPLGLRSVPAASADPPWFASPGRGWEIPPGAAAPARCFAGEGTGTAEVLARAGGPGGPPWILEVRRGEGTVLLLADAAPLTNEGIGNPAHAVLAVRLVEEVAAGGPVRFSETVHGFGEATDPDRALARMLLRTPLGNAALGAAAFGLLLLLADAKRFGRVRRTIDRPRRSEYEYLDALAGMLLTSKAWRETGRYLLLGVARRIGWEGRREGKPTVEGIARALSWDRPAEADRIREGVAALASGASPEAMARALAALDPALPPERSSGEPSRRREAP